MAQKLFAYTYVKFIRYTLSEMSVSLIHLCMQILM